MKGKDTYTSNEIHKLKELIILRNNSSPSKQKRIRDMMRQDLKFYGRDDWGITDLQIRDLENLIELGHLKIIDTSNAPKTVFSNLKQSFSPISNINTEILILGTIPGDKSLEMGEYYGHPRNRFWKIISTITNNELPITYSAKKELLSETKIGVWDVAHKAQRKGSSDSAIKKEVPNDLDSFIKKHKNLKVIAFNGSKSEILFNKYFQRNDLFRYILLPSSSPANTRLDFDSICHAWRSIHEI